MKQVVVRQRRHRTSTTRSTACIRRAPSFIPARGNGRGAARAARDRGCHGVDRPADLCRRRAPPPQEGRAGRPRTAGVHQRTGLRRLRRLLVQSNCVAVLPRETPLGRKRQIDQSSCNKDYSCVKVFCPSFVGVLGGSLRKKAGALESGRSSFDNRVASLPRPASMHGPAVRPVGHRWRRTAWSPSVR